jgi:hypothetical protein
MAVRIYIEACRDPGFSVNGPLCRFANAVGELILGKQFKNESVRADFNSLKRKVIKPSLPLDFYESKKEGVVGK